LILALSSPASEDTTVAAENMIVNPEMNFQKSWETHGAIRIDNDTHFDDVAAAEGWDGTGDSLHPYIIESYNITSSGTNIYIWSARHFIIRDCYLQGVGGMSNPWGVYIAYAPNAQIENVTVFQKANAYYFYQADNIVISDSKANSCDNGFYFHYSDDIQLSEIETTNCTYNGIYLDESHRASVDISSISGPGERGIQVMGSDNVNLSSGVIHSFSYEGVKVNQSADCSIEGSEIYWNSDQGVYAHYSDGFTMQNCVIRNNGQQGIYLRQSDSCVAHNNTVFDNDNDGIYLFQSHDCNVTENEFYGHLDPVSDAGIYASSSNGGTASGNTIYDNRHSGIYLASSDNWEVCGNNIYSNVEDGIYGSFSSDGDIFANNISLNNEAGGDGGIYLYNADRWNITANRVLDNSGYGIYLYHSNDSILVGNTVDRSGDIGIYSRWAPRVHCEGNHVLDSDNHGINLSGGDNCTVIGNNVTGSGDPGNGYNSNGIYVSQCDRAIVTHNVASETHGTGIVVTGQGFEIYNLNVSFNEAFHNIHGIGVYNEVHESTITGNLLHNNTIAGLIMTYADDCYVTRNGFFHNDRYGIELAWFVDHCNFIENDFVSNELSWQNAFENEDNCFANVFDRNLWDDYSGTGAYVISSISEDYNPLYNLNLNLPGPTIFDFGSTPMTIELGAFAVFPQSYQIEIDDAPFESDDWDGENITIDVNSLSPGIYGLNLTISHMLGFSISDTMSFLIAENTPPEWVITPTDQVINEGELFSYQINATDDSAIAGYAINDTVHFAIDSTGLITNIVPLTAGVYYLTVTAIDIYDNEIQAVFKVTVLATTPTTTTTTTTTTTEPPIDPMLLLAIGGGAVVVVIILVVVLRRPRGD
jgi:parallel beta-helix repeat protein